LIRERREINNGDNIATIEFIQETETNSITSVLTRDYVFRNIDYWRGIDAHYKKTSVINRYAGLKHIVKYITIQLPTCSEQGKLHLLENIKVGSKKVKAYERACRYAETVIKFVDKK